MFYLQCSGANTILQRKWSACVCVRVCASWCVTLDAIKETRHANTLPQPPYEHRDEVRVSGWDGTVLHKLLCNANWSPRKSLN